MNKNQILKIGFFFSDFFFSNYEVIAVGSSINNLFGSEVRTQSSRSVCKFGITCLT